VVHPVHGFVELQLVSVTENVQPVDNGGITEFNTDWIEPIDPETLKTARELAGAIDTAIDDLNRSALEEFLENVSQRTEALTNAIENAANTVNNIITNATEPLFTGLDILNNAINGVQRSYQSVVTNSTIVLESLAGQLQQIAQLPALGSGDGQAKLNAYSEAASGISDVLPRSGLLLSESSELQRNEVATTQLGQNATLGGVAKVARVASLTTRAQAIELAEEINGLYDSMVSNLELAQNSFEELDIDEQWVAQSGTATDSAQLVATVTEFLITVAPDLKIERRFTLDRPRSPIEITVSEYGSLGENDENFDLFIETNGLKGQEIFLLDRGREVVVYV
jgi:hypothetical protein